MRRKLILILNLVVILILVLTACSPAPTPMPLPTLTKTPAPATAATATPARDATGTPAALAWLAVPPAPATMGAPAAPAWNQANFQRAFEPANRRGRNPVYAALGVARQALEDDGGLGSSNFQFDVPVLQLPGRGLDLTLNLHYNSLLWTRLDTMVFDVDGDWPAPGWSLGFGKLIASYEGAMLIDGDGTRHYAEMTASTVAGPVRGISAQTKDGSLISCTLTWYDGHLNEAKAYLPNGTVIEYGASTWEGVAFPTRLTDANGNTISIVYRNNEGPAIDTITDTLGRVVRFYYEPSTSAQSTVLTAIEAPGLAGGTRTVVRLHYSAHRLTDAYGNPGFDKSVLSDPVRCVNYSDGRLNYCIYEYDKFISVIDAIYYPGTDTGYWFGSADSYSSYGMLRRVSERRAMKLTAGSLTEQSKVDSPGMMTRERFYNYPAQRDYTLTSSPTYTATEEIWVTGQSQQSAITEYLIKGCPDTDPQCGKPSQVEVTYPDGTRSIQVSYQVRGQFDDGLVYNTQLVDKQGKVLQEQVMSWETGDRGAPRLKRVETFGETGQKAVTEYSYGPERNQVTEIRTYDYDGITLLRREQREYVTDPGYGQAQSHIFNLPSVVQVFDGSSAVPVSRVEYAYDGEALADTPGVTSHVTHSVYRGNVTSITRYADAANKTSAVTEERRYDVTGNLVSISGSCCVETAYTYGPETQYAFPSAVMRGDLQAGATARVSTQAKYDLGTSLILESTDANGNRTLYSYWPDTARLRAVENPAGSSVGYQYDDATTTVTETTHLVSGQIASQVVRRLNGLGLDRRVEVLAGDNVWNAVETQYDAMGRVSKRSRPFRQAYRPESADEQKYWDETTYDALGRAISVKAADGSTTTQAYNEGARPDAASQAPGQTVRTTDPWGRERWTRTDALGRLVEVVMPNPAGNGAVLEPGSISTQYRYDALGRLIESKQGPLAQVRRFRYDSLGRLTQQFMPEKLATLDDTGKYVGSGGQWSDVYAYDARGNLVSYTDARGAKVLYDHHGDPLNRLQAISYDVTGVGDQSSPVLPANAVHLEYVTSGDVTRVSQITTDGQSVETEAYDALGRLVTKNLALADWPYSALTVGYAYDSLNRLTQLTYPDRYGFSPAPQTVQYAFNTTNQIQTISVNGQDQASVGYDFSGQPQEVLVGPAGPYQLKENYAYDPATQLLTHQSVTRAGKPLLDLAYEYTLPKLTTGLVDNLYRGYTERTGQVTRVVDAVNPTAGRTYTYDAWGRLATAESGSSQPRQAYDWLQQYTYDAYGNRTDVKAFGPPQPTQACTRPYLCPATAPELPANWRDGLGSLTFDATTNRIATTGFAYDAAGNQIRSVRSDGRGQQYRYDAAGRLVQVLDDTGKAVESYTYYNATNYRLSTQPGDPAAPTRIFVWQGNAVIAEYQAMTAAARPTVGGGLAVGTGGTPLPPRPRPGQINIQWIKNYIYAGDRLLSTRAPDASGKAEVVQYHHPDRLGTRLITDASDPAVIEQSTLPFGTLPPGATSSANKRLFTSYDHSAATGLDYALNRTYNPSQGRFAQVDPIGMRAASLLTPQSLNIYGYVQNDPVNATDALGLTAPVNPSGCGMLPGDTWGLGGCVGGLPEVGYAGADASSPSGTSWPDPRLGISPSLAASGKFHLLDQTLSLSEDAASEDTSGKFHLLDQTLSLSEDATSEDTTVSETDDPYSSMSMCGLCGMTYWLYVDSPMAKAEKTSLVAVGNVAGQVGATIGEIVLGLTLRPIAYTTDYHLGELQTRTLWELVQRGFNPVYVHIWEGHAQKKH